MSDMDTWIAFFILILQTLFVLLGYNCKFLIKCIPWYVSPRIKMIHWIASSYTSGNFCKKQAFLEKSPLNFAFFPTEDVKDQSIKWGRLANKIQQISC